MGEREEEVMETRRGEGEQEILETQRGERGKGREEKAWRRVSALTQAELPGPCRVERGEAEKAAKGTKGAKGERRANWEKKANG